MEHLVIKYQKDQFPDFFNIDNIPHFERKLCCSAWRGEDLDDAQRAETRALSMPGLTCHRWYRSGGHGQLHIFNSNFKMWAAVLALGKDFSKRDRRVISGTTGPQATMNLVSQMNGQKGWLKYGWCDERSLPPGQMRSDHPRRNLIIYSQTTFISDTFSISRLISVICYSFKKL